MKSRKVFAASILSFALTMPVYAQDFGADALNSAAGANGAGYANTPLTIMVGLLIRAILGLLSIIFFLYTLYAGFLWMTAGGESDKVDDAKDILKRAIIGMAIMMSAYAITQFVFAQTAMISAGTATPGM